jgi:poly(A) polymerase
MPALGEAVAVPLTPRVYSRSEHGISRARISANALKVLYRLNKAGYQACLVGGCVRDLLLGREPKDFDVVTDAHPEEIRAVFRNCRLIGRRFRLAHVHFGSEVVEVATFRGAGVEDDRDAHDRVLADGRILRDNVYGTIEEDVWRRDFTVNALYYNIRDFSVVDYVGGMVDHQAGTLRLIGDPERRYREDPVRMLRAVRFATKLGFVLHESCAKPLSRLAGLLEGIPAARLFEEVLKLFLAGYAVQNFEQLRHYGLFQPLFPLTEECLSIQRDAYPPVFLIKALENTDARLAENKPVAPYFLFAALLWEPVRIRAERYIAEGQNEIMAYQEASSEVIEQQVRQVAVPRSITMPMREVWLLQPRFASRAGARPFRLLSHPRFRAAYDFLLLRAESGGVERELADWWTRFQEADESERKTMIQSLSSSGRKPRRRRSRRRGGGAHAVNQDVHDSV